jgi:hypothetical protein
VADLYSTYPAAFLEYVNAPIGKPLRFRALPWAFLPPRLGRRSRPAIFDLRMHAKTGISYQVLRPSWASSIPENTRIAWLSPARRDVFSCHRIVTALPFGSGGPASPARPDQERTRQQLWAAGPDRFAACSARSF